MVSRREKLSRSYFRLREQTFHKQIALLSSGDIQKNLSIIELNALRQANHGSNVYDTMYSSEDRCKKEEDFDKIVQLISGLEADSAQLKKVIFYFILQPMTKELMKQIKQMNAKYWFNGFFRMCVCVV